MHKLYISRKVYSITRNVIQQLINKECCSASLLEELYSSQTRAKLVKQKIQVSQKTKQLAFLYRVSQKLCPVYVAAVEEL